MKSFSKLLLTLLFITLCKSYVKAKLEKFTSLAKCEISSINIPKGSNLPVINFKINKDDGEMNLTVVEKEHLEKYRVNGKLVFQDKTNGESWYADSKYDQKSFENMKDVFSKCKNIH